jgi:signal transduction histidine kinase/CheY-like chemotaxis protein
MNGISDRATQYLREELVRRERFIVVVLDADRQMLAVQGSTPDWRLPGLNRGAALPETLDALLDAADGATEPMVFPYVEMGDYFIDVHVLSEQGTAELVLHDVTEAHRQEQVLQQRAHEISLLSDRRAAMNKELATLNQELFKRRRQAEKASAAKSRFIASMSHEFRSPISSIMGYADLLRAELPDSRNPRAIQRASWHLLTLVENLLEQAREGDTDVPLNPTRFSLDRLMGDIRALFRAQADAKGLDLIVEAVPEGIDIELDELRLRQVLINLVSNALRYTTSGHVSVRAEHGEGILQLCVHDTGQGIEAEDMERIFEPFTRVGESSTSGAGLGLTITRQLVRRMNGQLEVDSKPGVSSEFLVRIPCPRLSDNEEKMPALHGELLWVDDDQDILSLYQVLLEDWGLRVYTAGSVAQAKEIMKSQACPVVVTDLHLTDGDGIELLTYLQAVDRDIQGIIISGSGVTELAPETLENGIRAFLQKPLDLAALHAELSAAFARVSASEVV